MRRYGELSKDQEPSLPHEFCSDCIIATRGYDFREGQPDATAHPSLQHNQLMSECRVLCLKSAFRLERRGEQGQEEAEQRDHRR
jgi:hypothetical protein